MDLALVSISNDFGFRWAGKNWEISENRGIYIVHTRSMLWEFMSRTCKAVNYLAQEFKDELNCYHLCILAFCGCFWGISWLSGAIRGTTKYRSSHFRNQHQKSHQANIGWASSKGYNTEVFAHVRFMCCTPSSIHLDFSLDLDIFFDRSHICSHVRRQLLINTWLSLLRCIGLLCR